MKTYHIAFDVHCAFTEMVVVGSSGRVLKRQRMATKIPDLVAALAPLPFPSLPGDCKAIPGTLSRRDNTPGGARPCCLYTPPSHVQNGAYPHYHRCGHARQTWYRGG